MDNLKVNKLVTVAAKNRPCYDFYQFVDSLTILSVLRAKRAIKKYRRSIQNAIFLIAFLFSTKYDLSLSYSRASSAKSLLTVQKGRHKNATFFKHFMSPCRFLTSIYCKFNTPKFKVTCSEQTATGTA